MVARLISGWSEVCHQVVNRASPNLSTGELLSGLSDAGYKGGAAPLSLSAPDDLDQILLLLLRQPFDQFKSFLKRRDGWL